MGLFEELNRSFSLVEVEPYGRVLVVPSKEFHQEWLPQLQREGVKVYSGAYNSQVCFFLKANNDAYMAETTQNSEKTNQLWTKEEEETLLKMKSAGLSYSEIAKRLGKTAGACYSKWKRLRRVQEAPLEHGKGRSTQDDAVQEFIEALSMLYPKHRRICLFLLKHAGEVVDSSV